MWNNFTGKFNKKDMKKGKRKKQGRQTEAIIFSHVVTDKEKLCRLKY